MALFLFWFFKFELTRSRWFSWKLLGGCWEYRLICGLRFEWKVRGLGLCLGWASGSGYTGRGSG